MTGTGDASSTSGAASASGAASSSSDTGSSSSSGTALATSGQAVASNFAVIPAAMCQHAQDLGAQYMFRTKLVQCIVEDGKVTGVVAQAEGDSHLRINASKGVLIATGGYEGDDDLITALQPETTELMAFSGAYPQNMGEGIKAGIWAGGRKQLSTAFMLFDRGAVASADAP